jgi:hypothetical protein
MEGRAPSNPATGQPPFEQVESDRDPPSCFLSMTLSDLPSPAEAGFAKAGNRFPLFEIML